MVLENADWLEYFAQDEATGFIAMYVESVRDGRRFFQLLKETCARKPVVIWKGGQTAEGKRATSSHTGAIAESMDTWDVVIRQAGAIRADSMTETVDILKALTTFAPFTGDGIGLTGGSGGQSVSMSDAFSKAGLRVPMLTRESFDRLEEFFQVIGASYLNPVDMGGMNRPMMESIVDIRRGGDAAQPPRAPALGRARRGPCGGAHPRAGGDGQAGGGGALLARPLWRRRGPQGAGPAPTGRRHPQLPQLRARRVLHQKSRRLLPPPRCAMIGP